MAGNNLNKDNQGPMCLKACARWFLNTLARDLLGQLQISNISQQQLVLDLQFAHVRVSLPLKLLISLIFVKL